MAICLTIILAGIFFVLQKDRLKEHELMIPALVGLPLAFFGIRRLLDTLFPTKTVPQGTEELVNETKELPAATYENWKADLEKVVENTMGLDEFLDRWRGRGPDRKMKELEKVAQEPPAQKTRNRVKEMLEEARRKIGV